jgi:hypothetical protein
MAYTPRIKDTLLIASGQGQHLHVIVTAECAYHHHLLVNFSTVRGGKPPDTACILRPKEHRFLKVESYVAYQFARTIDAQHLRKCVDGRTFVPDDPVSDALLEDFTSLLSLSVEF